MIINNYEKHNHLLLLVGFCIFHYIFTFIGLHNREGAQVWIRFGVALELLWFELGFNLVLVWI